MTQRDQDREDFEAEAREDGLAPGTWDDETSMYDDSDTQRMWQGWQAAIAHERTRAQGEPAAVPDESFQARVDPWMQACFGPEISADRLERGDRLLEEVLELLQSGGYPSERVSALTGYVWSRPAGDPPQEAGGVMVTLAAYCLAHGLDMHEAGETELARIWTKVEKIRAKQAAKPTGSALPQAWLVAAPEPAKAEVVAQAPQPGAVLEWVEAPPELPTTRFIAKSEAGTYYVCEDAWRTDGCVWLASGNIEGAKSAAQADYERRILSALATPPTAPAAARSAAEEMRERCAVAAEGVPLHVDPEHYKSRFRVEADPMRRVGRHAGDWDRSEGPYSRGRNDAALAIRALALPSEEA